MNAAGLILVFTKPAVPGRVKTRLIPPFTPTEAAEFHLAALDDIVAAAQGVAGGEVQLCVAGDDETLDDFRRRYPGVQVWPQSEGDLGARLTAAFEDAFAADCERALIVGSDHPTVPAENLAEGLARLGSADVSLGPSRDGGYYAVGIRRGSWPAAATIFRNIPWSTPQVLEAGLAQAHRAGLNVVLLPQWYDVDRAGDLELLLRDASPDSASARFLRALESRRLDV